MQPRPFRIVKVRVYLLVVMGAAYLIALALYPSISRGAASYAYFKETYIGCLCASAALSALAVLVRSELWIEVVFLFRLYILIVMGYSIGGFVSAKLVLGVGLMTEIGVLCAFPASLVLCAVAMAAFVAAQAWPVFFGPSGLVNAPYLPGPDELGVLSFALALSAATAILIARMAVREKELDDAIRVQEGNLEAIAELNLNLQGYARTVDEESAERERNRISREIHDISGYIFTNLIALMDAAGSMRRDDMAGLTDILVTARAQAQEGLRETRIALRKLRSEQTGLTDCTRAIYKIVDIFRKLARIDIELSLGNMPHFLSQDLGLALYRTVQEGLTNAVRHGKATKVRVSFWVKERDLLLTIADNGKGAEEMVKGIGITGMEERIGALGGTVDAVSPTEGGFTLSVRVPLKTAAEGQQD
jgi:signal transduction histidine kinase